MHILPPSDVPGIGILPPDLHRRVLDLCASLDPDASADLLARLERLSPDLAQADVEERTLARRLLGVVDTWERRAEGDLHFPV